MAIKKKRASSGSMPFQMTSVDSGAVKVNCLFYGPTGSGKTRLLGTAEACPETSPIFILAIDPGTLSLQGIVKEVFRPKNFKEIQQAYDYLRFENHSFRSVGIDSLSEAHDKLAMGSILGVTQDDDSHSNLDSRVPADRYDWLQSGEQMRRMIRAYRDLAYLSEEDRRLHVFMTALERTDEKRSVICPALPGALGVSIGASIDVLAYMQKVRVEVREGVFKKRRKLFTEEFENADGFRVLAKARTPVNIEFPDEISAPTIAKVLSCWNGESQA